MRFALIWIFWPSFLVAGITSGLIFAFIDPLDVTLFGRYSPADRQTFYSGTFFFFWVMAALSSATTLLLSNRLVSTMRKAP